MRKKAAFTMLELLFAIVVIGILSKFGVEFLAQAYRGFIYSNVNHALQAQSASTVEIIASRLQYRIKESVIARRDNALNSFYSVNDLNTTFLDRYTVLEWIGEDIEGFRGTQLPFWSGVFDLENPIIAMNVGNILVSLETNTTNINNTILILSDNSSNFGDAALYFTGATHDITTFGWQGIYADTAVAFNNPITDQLQSVHPINSTVADSSYFIPSVGTMQSVDIYEYYKLFWTAYAISFEDYNNTTQAGKLFLYYNYQPWLGESYSDPNVGIKKTLLAENVSTFRFFAIDSLLKIQVCIKSNLLKGEEHSICKDKTIF